jgi:hypothetical protein
MHSGLRPRLRPRGASAPEGGLSGPEGDAERAARTGELRACEEIRTGNPPGPRPVEIPPRPPLTKGGMGGFGRGGETGSALCSTILSHTLSGALRSPIGAMGICFHGGSRTGRCRFYSYLRTFFGSGFTDRLARGENLEMPCRSPARRRRAAGGGGPADGQGGGPEGRGRTVAGPIVTGWPGPRVGAHVRKTRRTSKLRHPLPEWPAVPSGPYLAAWMALAPAERLRRAWALRRRLRNPQAVHDAKTFPQL